LEKERKHYLSEEVDGSNKGVVLNWTVYVLGGRPP
jgi:hypothetical protein